MPLAMKFPLLGLTRDLHPLDNAHAERTKNPWHDSSKTCQGFMEMKSKCLVGSIVSHATNTKTKCTLISFRCITIRSIVIELCPEVFFSCGIAP